MDVDEYIKTLLIPEMVKLNSFKLNNSSNIQIIKIDVKAPENSLMLASLKFVKVELKDSEDNKITKEIVVKTMPICDAEYAEGAKFDALFNNEIRAYTECIKLIKQEELFAKCLYTNENCKHFNKVIVMEDLKENNYVMTESTSWLSMDHIVLAMKTLGKFHGNCYVLKEKDPKKFYSVTAMFEESRYDEVENEIFKDFMLHSMKRVGNYVRANNILKQEKFRKKVDAILENSHRYFLKTIKPIEPLSVICHGDYTRNNMAFKYDENKKPIDIKLFDLQTLRYASPGIDLATFLFLYCTPDDQRKHWDLIFGTYHVEIVKALCVGLEKDEKDLPEYYSLNSMIKHFVENSLHGCLVSFYYLAAIVDPVKVDYLTYMKETPYEEQINDVYNRGGEIVDKALAQNISFLEELEQKYQCEVQDLD